MVTDPEIVTHTQTGLVTIHCAAASAQCNNASPIRQFSAPMCLPQSGDVSLRALWGIFSPYLVLQSRTGRTDEQHQSMSCPVVVRAALCNLNVTQPEN